jgi:HEPN domain-containing protein
MRSRERAEILLRKAAQDEFTVLKLIPDPASPDEVIGFHAQQAVEKMLKAVLSFKSVRYRRTHDLVELMDLVRENGITFPEIVEESRRLGPFATTFRYDDLLAEPEEPFDRSWALECIRRTRAWAESVVGLQKR